LLDGRRRWSVVLTAAQRIESSRGRSASRGFRPPGDPVVDPAVDQDGRLPGRLRLLSAGRTLRHGCGKPETAVCRGSAGRGIRGESEGRDALLHGRGLARTEAERPRAGTGNGPRGEIARPGNLRHARLVARRPG